MNKENEEISEILKFVHNNINSSLKWESSIAVPFQFTNDYDQLKTFFEDFPKIPFITIKDDVINFTGLIHALISLEKNQTISISISPLYYIPDNIIGIKISIGNKHNKITIDKIKIILSAITNHDIIVSDSQSQSIEGIIKIENGDELSVFSFDFDTFTINGYSSTSQEKNDSYSISFLAKSNFLDEFYSYSNEFMIQMIYYPSESLNISFGSNSLLLNIPKTQNRFLDFAEYLFPQSMKHAYSHTEQSEELNAISTVNLIYFVVPKNATSKANKTSNGSKRSQKSNDETIDSLFMLFTFINGIPQESNCHMSLELLSSITWSDLSISFIPMPIENFKKGLKYSNDDFILKLENAKGMPYCTCSSIVDKPRTVIMAFLNTTKESAHALSRIALTKAFEKIHNLYPKRKSYVRLNRIWESIDTISTSLSVICDDESLYPKAWNGCCSVLDQYTEKLKNTQEMTEKEIDDQNDEEYDEEIQKEENDESEVIDHDIETTILIDLSDEDELTDQENSRNEMSNHIIEAGVVVDLDDESEIADQRNREKEAINQKNEEKEEYPIELAYF